MRRVFGPRTVVEAAFLVAVPVVAAAFGAGRWTIIAASAVAYLLIVVLEATLWREGAHATSRPRMRIPSRTVTVRRATSQSPQPQPLVPQPSEKTAEPVAVPAQASAPEAVSAPKPEQVQVPQPSFAASTPPEHVRVLRPEPEPVQEPEPAVVARPQLTAVHEPEPTPVAPAPVPEPSTVVPIGVGAGPRRWSLWELERLTREHAGVDAAQDEERQFLLMYLREFADGDGLLPVDFDDLVRDSFGELVGSR